MSESRAQQCASSPPRYKLALITWAGAYAVITLILAVFEPTMAAWPLPLRSLLLSALMVTALTWLVIPSLTRLFRGWLAPRSPPRSPTAPSSHRRRECNPDRTRAGSSAPFERPTR